MSVLMAMFRSVRQTLPRYVFSWIKCLTLPGAQGSVIHPSVFFGGRGQPVLGTNITIGSQVRLNCAKQGRFEMGTGCRIGAGAEVAIAEQGYLRMLPGSEIGTQSSLVVAADWFMASRSTIAGGCEIAPREQVKQPGKLELGEGSMIADHALIDLTGNLTIEQNVAIGAYVVIYTHNHRYQAGGVAAWKTPLEIGDVISEEGAWIGTRVTILPGVRIGARSVIAAGAVVVRDVPANTLCAGVPAKVIREINPACPN
jgi:acetyltransferase-like isoleucine patch superfamily enzyme